MEEQIILFKTALLAKEKEFNPKHSLRYHYYTHDGILNGDVTDLIKAQLGNKNNTIDTNIMESLQTIKASTQSLLQKWLREKHELYVESNPNASGYGWFIEKTNGTSIANSAYTGPNDGGRWDIYEDALEEGLLNALSLIK